VLIGEKMTEYSAEITVSQAEMAELTSVSRPQVKADQHQAAAWMPHSSALHMHKPTRTTHTATAATFHSKNAAKHTHTQKVAQKPNL